MARPGLTHYFEHDAHQYVVHVHQTANLSATNFQACVCTATQMRAGRPIRLVAENGAAMFLVDAPDMDSAARFVETVVKQGGLKTES
jgi:hypothetical protein